MTNSLRTRDFPQPGPAWLTLSGNEAQDKNNRERLINSITVDERQERRNKFLQASLNIARSAAQNKLQIAIIRTGSLVYSRLDDYVRDVDLMILIKSSETENHTIQQLNEALGIRNRNFTASEKDMNELFSGRTHVLRFKYIDMGGVPLDISLSTAKNVREFLSPLKYHEQINCSIYNSEALPKYFTRKLIGLSGNAVYKTVAVEQGRLTREPGIFYIPSPINTFTIPPGYETFIICDVLYDQISAQAHRIQDTLLKIVLRYGVFRYNYDEIYDRKNGLREEAEQSFIRLFMRKERFSPEFKERLKQRFISEFKSFQARQ